jgi:hypothetical protein
MDDYISRKDAIETIHKTIYEIFGYQDGKVFTDTDELLLMVNKLLCKKIREIPAADVVKVIRCKDCKAWSRYGDTGMGYCDLSGINWHDNDFCCYGEMEVKTC